MLIYISLFSSNRTDRNIHNRVENIRHLFIFFFLGVEARLRSLNDRVERLEQKDSALSGPSRGLISRILFRLRGASASASARD